MSDNYNLIKKAIKEKKQIHADYGGHRREMCPHILGAKGGRSQALFYQFAGGSSSGLSIGGEWRCMAVDELSNVEIKEGEWHTKETRTHQRSTCVDDIDCEVDLS